MADDNDKPDNPIPDAPGVGEASGADAEKAAMVDQAKARVAAEIGRASCRERV